MQCCRKLPTPRSGNYSPDAFFAAAFFVVFFFAVDFFLATFFFGGRGGNSNDSLPVFGSSNKKAENGLLVLRDIKHSITSVLPSENSLLAYSGVISFCKIDLAMRVPPFCLSAAISGHR